MLKGCSCHGKMVMKTKNSERYFSRSIFFDFSEPLFVHVIYQMFEIKYLNFIMYRVEVQTADRIYCRLLNMI